MAVVAELLRSHMPADQSDWLDLAQTLGQGKLRERAARMDEENRFPFENYDDLRQSGLLGLTVPKEFGGGGVDSVTYVGVLTEIAQGCASTGLTFSMHCAIIDFLTQIASPDQKKKYFNEVVNDGAVLASITSEPASSFRDVFRVKTQIVQDDDGYRLNGTKAWCSLSTAARYYFTWSRLKHSETLADGLLNVMVPSDRPGIEIMDDWDTLGMRATASNSIKFDNVRLEHDEVIGSPGVILTKDLSFWSLGYTAVYVGIAEAAYAYCLEHARTQLEYFEEDSAQATRIHRQIGELSITIESARRATQTLVLLRSSLSKADLTYMLNQAKYLATEAAYDIAQKGLRMMGGTGISRNLPMQQYLRDAIPGLVMPPANDRIIETVGKLALGLSGKTLEFR